MQRDVDVEALMERPGAGMMYRTLVATAFAVFITSNVALLIPHQRIAKGILDAVEKSRQLAVINICRDLERVAPAGEEAITGFIADTRSRYSGLADLRFVPAGETASPSIVRRGRSDCRTREGTLYVEFDSAPLYSLLRTTQLASVVSFLALAAGCVLISIHFVAVRKPLREFLGSNEEQGERDPKVSENTFLIDSFHTAIGSLRDQGQELKRLHAMEKSRADELARITSALTRSITSGFISFDPGGRVFDINEPARSMLGVEPRERTTGRDIAEIIGDTSFARYLREATENRACLQRTEVVHEGERTLTIGLTTVPIHDDEAVYLGTLALFTDLTPIRNLETRLRETQTLADLGEMSAGIAHEFRNSLATILGFLKLARRSNSSPDVERRLAEAESEANQLSDAVKGLLNFSRPMKLDLRVVDPPELLVQTAERLVSPKEGVRLEIDTEAFQIDGDSALLARAFENLLRNAIEAIEASGRTDGTIRIVTRAGSQPSVTIHDNGTGIDPADVPRLMLPFHSSKASGMGLGLPLARKIVLLHGGNLTIGGSPGVGCRAHIVFGLDDELRTSHGTWAAQGSD